MRNQPKLIVKEPAKRVGGDDRRDCPGNEVDRASEFLPAKTGIQEQGDEEADHKLQECGAEHEDDGKADGAADAEIAG